MGIHITYVRGNYSVVLRSLYVMYVKQNLREPFVTVTMSTICDSHDVNRVTVMMSAMYDSHHARHVLM